MPLLFGSVFAGTVAQIYSQIDTACIPYFYFLLDQLYILKFAHCPNLSLCSAAKIFSGAGYMKYKVFVLCCICIMFVFVLVLCLYCLCICICSWQFVLNCPELSLQATKARAEFSAKVATLVRF